MPHCGWTSCRCQLYISQGLASVGRPFVEDTLNVVLVDQNVVLVDQTDVLVDQSDVIVDQNVVLVECGPIDGSKS